MVKPTNKTSIGALAGAITLVIVFCVQQFAKVTIPAEIAMSMTTIITFVTQYFVPDADPPPPFSKGTPNPPGT